MNLDHPTEATVHRKNGTVETVIDVKIVTDENLMDIIRQENDE